MDGIAAVATAEAAIFPAGAVGAVVTRDFDEMVAAARGWDQCYMKLQTGPFRGEVVVAHTGRLQIATAAWSCGVRSVGSVPRGSRTFGLIACEAGLPRHNGRAVRPGHLATCTDRDGLDFLTPGGCEMVLVSFAHGLLDRATATMLDMSWDEASRAMPILGLADLSRAEAGLRRLHAAACAAPWVLQDPGRAGVIEEQAAVGLLGQLDLPPRWVAPNERRRLARRVEDYVRAHRHRAVTIAELCAAVGAPERTLHLACREHLGLPPITYLRVLRLHGARRDLRVLGRATTVTDTATSWGFFHFGEFAAAYRRQFGELPSQTLQRGAGGYMSAA